MRGNPSCCIFVALCCLKCGAICLRAKEGVTGAGYRSHALKVPEGGEAGFTRLPGHLTGITFSNHLSDASAAANQIRLNGSGVAAGDVDGDGWCDLYFCGLEGGNRLYRNLGGWHFEDITDEAGVRCAGQYSTGAVFADVDGDGDLDLLVNSIGGGTRLFLNDGKGHFHESTNSGLVRQFGAMSMALGDLRGEGVLDLYVANYRSSTMRSTGLDLLEVNGKLQLKPEDRENFELTPEGGLFELGEPDILYRNDGHGHYTPVSWTNGVFLDEKGNRLTELPRDWGLSVMFRDIDEDGAPDIYVCNDFASPDRVWINDGTGHFHALSAQALRCTSTFSMGIDFADVNRDGHDDFFVVDMLNRGHRAQMTQTQILPARFEARPTVFERAQLKRNVLQLNRGDGTFAEVAQLSGLEASGWSWTAVFLDVDLDGYEDVLIPTGHMFDTQDSDTLARLNASRGTHEQSAARLLEYPRLPLPNLAFRNLGNLRFEEMGRQWGFDRVGVKHGICCADLDNDGDLDVITNDLNDEAGVYRNNCSQPRVAVRLKGAASNTRGIGSKIWLYGGAVPIQSQEMICGGRYLSCDDAVRVFAAGSLTNRMRIEVRWRSGKRSVVKGVKPNREYEIEEESEAR
jgi:enediyne biosynthesis protein E4